MSSLAKGTVKVDIRSDTSGNFTSANPTLKAGEPAFETDTKKLKVGDGSTAWTSLVYTAIPLTFGIANGNSLKVDEPDGSYTASDGDIAQFTSTGIKGVTHVTAIGKILLDYYILLS